MSAISIQLEQLVGTYMKGGLPSHEFSQDTTGILTLFSPKVNDTLQLANARSLHLAELDMVKRDKGLHLNSGATSNFLGSVLEEDGSFYDWRANAGLDWNLFGTAGKSQTKGQQKELQWQADRYDFDKQMRDLGYRKTFDFIIYTFNRRKVKLIKQRPCTP